MMTGEGTKILEMTIRKHGKIIQTYVAIEEMSELIKELSKDMRGENNYTALLEEMADVYIVLEQIQMMHDISDKELDEMLIKKMKRLGERLKGETK